MEKKGGLIETLVSDYLSLDEARIRLANLEGKSSQLLPPLLAL